MELVKKFKLIALPPYMSRANMKATRELLCRKLMAEIDDGYFYIRLGVSPKRQEK